MLVHNDLEVLLEPEVYERLFAQDLLSHANKYTHLLRVLCGVAKCMDFDLCRVYCWGSHAVLRYNRVQLSTAVNTSGGQLVSCPQDGCHNVIARDATDSPYCICNACNHEWCEDCHVDWHKDIACAVYQEWKQKNEQGDQALEKMKQDGAVKQCPNCLNWGSKEKGHCNATT